ncbi:hypothetical protein GCM10023340_21370 [Nocardioides marinquilinus]|uniref:Uncharacterized protein n=1 Tax=Nocardioides marinquilinus TaxID=1210400 RepID=A0ABP9PQA4_9ACTN
MVDRACFKVSVGEEGTPQQTYSVSASGYYEWPPRRPAGVVEPQSRVARQAFQPSAPSTAAMATLTTTSTEWATQ